MINLFVSVTNSDGDLSNWIMLVISILILLPVTMIIGNKISKDISNNEQNLAKTLFKIDQFIYKKYKHAEHNKLINVYNRMNTEFDGIFIKDCRTFQGDSNNFQKKLTIFKPQVDLYKESVEEYYEYLSGFTEDTASYTRIRIKNTIKCLEKLKHNDLFYFLEFNDCSMLVSDVGLILAHFKKYVKTIDGISISVSEEFKEYLD